jgi:integrase/recombinase XerD
MGVMSKHIPYTKTLNSFATHVQLKDLRERSIISYIAKVRHIGEYFAIDPALLDEDQVRSYFLFLRVEKKYASSTMNQARVALKTFYHEHLKHPLWPVFAEVKTRHNKTLPVVISREEVRELLAAVTEPRYYTLFSLLYSCGLRLSEALHVQVEDIDQQLAQHEAMHKAEKPMSPSSAQDAMKWAAAASRQKKNVTSHTLRHCYATHLLEGGSQLRYISSYLGHASLTPTLVYVHLTSVGEEQTQQVLRTMHTEVVERDLTPPAR